MTRYTYPLHIRHDPDGQGPICYQVTKGTRAVDKTVDGALRAGLDVHPAEGCRHYGTADVPR